MGGIGTDLIALANDPRMDLVTRRKLLSSITELYRKLHAKYIMGLPGDFIPSDNQLLHIMVGAMTTGDLGMETKWGPVALERLLGERMDAF